MNKGWKISCNLRVASKGDLCRKKDISFQMRYQYIKISEGEWRRKKREREYWAQTKHFSKNNAKGMIAKNRDNQLQKIE